ncbi:hypothetical protein PSY55_23820, partial [Shigella flexneri]|nr:hypothetical protein [Shigella flexneri]
SGCEQNGSIKFTHNYLSLFCNKKGTRNGAFFIAEKREVIMRKLYAAILSAAICLAADKMAA